MWKYIFMAKIFLADVTTFMAAWIFRSKLNTLFIKIQQLLILACIPKKHYFVIVGA